LLHASIAGDFAAETGRATKPTIENVAKIKIGAVPVFIGIPPGWLLAPLRWLRG
jgi:hypothetical protein